MSSVINTVLYLGALEITNKNNRVYTYAGAHGYTYDTGVEGRKALKRAVPTTTGYYNGSNQDSTTVVIPIDIISGIYSFSPDLLTGALTLIRECLKHMATIDNSGNLAINSLIPGVERIINVNVKDATKKDGKFDTIQYGKLLISEDSVKTISEIQTLLGKLPNTKLWFGDNLLAEGGLGSKRLTQQLAMAEIYVKFGGKSELVFDYTPLKVYEEPESDLNKVINASRWYFNTGAGTDFYETFDGYRGYFFGKVEKDKKYYGKVTPDVTYSAFYSKHPVEYLDNLYEFAKLYVKNPKELLLAGNMQYMSSKDIIRLNKSHPGVPKGKDLVVPFQVGAKEDATLIELIDPPALSYLINENNFNFNLVLNAFLNRDVNNRFSKTLHFVDVTDMVYDKTPNKKGEVKLKLNPDFKTSETVFRVKVKHRRCKIDVPLMLSIGYDTPDRNSFNSVSDPNVRVWVAVDDYNDKCISYQTLVTTDDWIYLHSGAKGTNIRVLNKKELEHYID